MKPNYISLKPALLLLLVASCQTALSAVMVNLTASPIDGGTFLYTIEVTNTEPQALAIVSISDAPKGQSLIGTSLQGPLGFKTSYEPGAPADMFGKIDLLEDALTFTSNSVTGGFTFESSTAPFTGFFNNFTAFDRDTNIINGTTNVIPEPAAAILGILGWAGLFLRRRR